MSGSTIHCVQSSYRSWKAIESPGMTESNSRALKSHGLRLDPRLSWKSTCEVIESDGKQKQLTIAISLCVYNEEHLHLANYWNF